MANQDGRACPVLGSACAAVLDVGIDGTEPVRVVILRVAVAPLSTVGMLRVGLTLFEADSICDETDCAESGIADWLALTDIAVTASPSSLGSRRRCV